MAIISVSKSLTGSGLRMRGLASLIALALALGHVESLPSVGDLNADGQDKVVLRHHSSDERTFSLLDAHGATRVRANAVEVHAVWLFPSASDPSGRRGFARVVNRTGEAGEVSIVAIDDAGTRRDRVTLSLHANSTAHFNSNDLEIGNAAKGLSGGVGSGEGAWRLELTSALDIEVLSYIRSPGGFLTAMHDLAPSDGMYHRVPIFNPGSNPNQVSVLRLINAGNEAAQVRIAGIDDAGESPGREVQVSVPAGAATTLSAAALEFGGEGFEGALGDGAGKWRLTVISQPPVATMSLLENSTGHLTNLSTAPRPHRGGVAQWAKAFVADNHVVDGTLYLSVRIDPDCTTDCERAFFPGTGPPDLGTIKEVTGVDLSIASASNEEWFHWVTERINDGRISNVRTVRTYADIETAQSEGDHALMFYVQRRATPRWSLEGDVTTLRRWYDDGLRVLQLAYGTGPERPDARTLDERLAHGSGEGENMGVTELGRAAIAEMNALGMIVDVSHSSRQTVLDAAMLSTAPIVATHANAEALTPISRNKDDEELLAIARTGGVIGVTPIRFMLDTDGDRRAGMSELIDHIEYMVDLVGIDHVAVATDSYIDGWDEDSSYYTDADLAAADRWVRLTIRLRVRGWSEDDLAKLLGGNFRRVFEEVL